MWDISQHMESMECYACHADWVPQCWQKVSENDWLKNDAHQDLMKKALEAYSANKK
jgi:hypothetical protein